MYLLALWFELRTIEDAPKRAKSHSERMEIDRKLAVVGNSRRRLWKGALIFSGLVLLATAVVMVFVPTEHVLLELGAMVAGLVAGAVLVRFGVTKRWMGSAVLVLFIAVWFALGTAGYAWFGGFLAGASAGVAWGRAAGNRAKEPVASDS